MQGYADAVKVVHPSVAAMLAWQNHQLMVALPNRGERAGGAGAGQEDMGLPRQCEGWSGRGGYFVWGLSKPVREMEDWLPVRDTGRPLHL